MSIAQDGSNEDVGSFFISVRYDSAEQFYQTL
jgi:hypothetical protein